MEVSDARGWLDMVRSVVLVVVPFVAGMLGGSRLKPAGNAVPLVIAGLVMAAAVFMALAVNTEWILIPAGIVPLLIFVWLLGMNVFLGPANSLIMRFTDSTGQVMAVSISLAVAELLYALHVPVGELIYGIGILPVFAGAGLLMLGVAFLFRKVFTPATESVRREQEVPGENRFGRIAVSGMLAGILLMIIQTFMPVWVLAKVQLPELMSVLGGGKDTLVSLVLIVAALASIPAARFSNRAGIVKVLVLGMAGTVISLAFSFVVPDPAATVIAVLAAGAFMALVMVALLPYTAAQVRTESQLTGTGILFAAVALPDAVVKIVLGL